LAENPYRVGKPLISRLAGLYSARRGEYRVVYAIDDDRVVVEVANIMRRSDVYGRR
jgi:mRNA interferase RelE/StbE